MAVTHTHRAARHCGDDGWDLTKKRVFLLVCSHRRVCEREKERVFVREREKSVR